MQDESWDFTDGPFVIHIFAFLSPPAPATWNPNVWIERIGLNHAFTVFILRQGDALIEPWFILQRMFVAIDSECVENAERDRSGFIQDDCKQLFFSFMQLEIFMYTVSKNIKRPF